jgi:hypothetical protein
VREAQNIEQEIGPVGHEPVHPEVEQATHLLAFVHGPHVHLNAEMMGSPNKAAVHYRKGTLAGWDLERIVGKAK